MKSSIYMISLLDLLWAFIPVGIMIIIYIRWTNDRVTIFYALTRMLIQLILIGYVLTYIFTSDSSVIETPQTPPNLSAYIFSEPHLFIFIRICNLLRNRSFPIQVLAWWNPQHDH